MSPAAKKAAPAAKKSAAKKSTAKKSTAQMAAAVASDGSTAATPPGG